MTDPITPEGVDALKGKTIPSVVIEVFNKLIARGWNGRESVVQQNEVVDLIFSRSELKREELFQNNYLDIEPLYEKVGWSVEYDKSSAPTAPTFTFTKRRTR